MKPISTALAEFLHVLYRETATCPKVIALPRPAFDLLDRECMPAHVEVGITHLELNVGFGPYTLRVVPEE